MRCRTILAASVVSTLLTAGAQAADIPARRAAPVMAPMPVVVAYDWTGWYVGLHLGGGWMRADFHDVTGNLNRNDGEITSDGWLGGGQIGFNWQTGGWVFGAELQGSLADLSGSRRSVFFRDVTVHNEVNSIVTLAARGGFAHQNWLWYGKVGGAWANADFHFKNNNGNSFGSHGDTLSGWMLGLGVEYAWSPNMSVKLEYNYMDFGEDTSSRLSCGGGCRFSEAVDRRNQVVMLGWNYRFPIR